MTTRRRSFGYQPGITAKLAGCSLTLRDYVLPPLSLQPSERPLLTLQEGRLTLKPPYLCFAVFTLLSSPLRPKQMELPRAPPPPQTRETHSNPNSGFSHLADANRIFTSLGRRLVGSWRSIHTAEQQPPLVPSLGCFLWRFKSFLSSSRLPNTKLTGFNGGTGEGKQPRQG